MIRDKTRSIWKFPFVIEDVVTIEMPAGAKVIHVELQGSTPCIWAVVDVAAPRVRRDFYVIGTGHPMVQGATSHIATFQQGPFVWHLFEVP